MGMNVTFFEPQIGRTTMMTDARLVGRAERDSETGKITGLKICGANKEIKRTDNGGCDQNSGGFVYLTIDGVMYTMSGQPKFKEGGLETEAEANADGSMSVTGKPVLHEADIEIRDSRDFDLAALKRCPGFVG